MIVNDSIEASHPVKLALLRCLVWLLAAWGARNVERLDCLFEARTDAATHLIFLEILLWSILMVRV